MFTKRRKNSDKNNDVIAYVHIKKKKTSVTCALMETEKARDKIVSKRSCNLKREKRQIEMKNKSYLE